MTRILVVDDQWLFRESLIRLLSAEPGFAITGGCDAATDAIGLLHQNPTDVVVMNDDGRGQAAFQIIDEMSRKGHACRVLIVTGGMTAGRMQRLLHAGCAGIFMKHSLPSQLINAIREAASGGTWLDLRAVRILVHAHGDPARLCNLSGREQAVLAEVIQGRSSKQISLALQTSEPCVKSALQRIFHKTGVRSRSQLIRMAFQNNFRRAA